MASHNRYSGSLSNLLHPILTLDMVRNWLKEDTPSFDYGGFVVGDKCESAVILCKSPGVLAGCPFVDLLFKELECKVEWYFTEGTYLTPVCTVGKVTGKVKNLLLGERVALNCLTRASGIASFSRNLANMAKEAGWHGEIAGTRKTTPGFRMVEKYSLIVGGISTHRYDLSSMIMLKDNHIWTAGNISQAVIDAKSVAGFSTKIEVECRSVEEATEALKAGADIVMLDNFQPEALHKAAKVVKENFSHAIIESSGGITVDSLKEYMGPNIDVISLSRTTQGYDVVDFSFKIMKEGHDPSNPKVA